MTINYSDLKFALTNRLLIVSWPAQNIECFCELNETRDHVDWCWMSGFETRETRRIASLLKKAGNQYLGEQRLHRLAQSAT